MQKNQIKKKTGAFIVPTGIGASIGGYAGDASPWARKFAKEATLIVNPNVVNAGGFSGITDEMLYVEGYILDEFFRNKVCLSLSSNNKIGVVFDKSITKEVLNIHINTINAVKSVYDVDVIGYELTKEDVGVEFYLDESGVSTGRVKNIETVKDAALSLLGKGAEAIAIVCRFSDEIINEDYENGIGVDPIGGVEAIISHYIAKELGVPCAHSPAFEDYSISTKIVNPKASSEYITPTFLPCVLLGLNNSPKIVKNDLNCKNKLSVNDLNFVVVPYNAIGSIPVIEAVGKGIKVFAVRENQSVLNVTNDLLCFKSGIVNVDTYQECLELIKEL